VLGYISLERRNIFKNIIQLNLSNIFETKSETSLFVFFIHQRIVGLHTVLKFKSHANIVRLGRIGPVAVMSTALCELVIKEYMLLT